MDSTSHRNRVLSRVAGAVVIIPLALVFAGCSGSNIPTCQEYAEMADSTGLGVGLSADQTSAIQRALDAEGFDDGALNVTIATGEILSYCNIYDGVANQNATQSITEAVKE